MAQDILVLQEKLHEKHSKNTWTRCTSIVRWGIVPWRESKSGSAHGRGGFDLTLGCGGPGRGRVRVRAEGGRGNRGSPQVNMNSDAEEHACTTQGPFATCGGTLHACVCHMREVHTCLGVPNAVSDHVVEADEQVWRDRGLQACEECLRWWQRGSACWLLSDQRLCYCRCRALHVNAAGWRRVQVSSGSLVGDV
jgi:hypothetical protein